MLSEELEGCDVCGADHCTEDCPQLATENDLKPASSVSRARLTLPHFLEVQNDGAGGLRVVATQTIHAKTKLGPFEAKRTTQEMNVGDGFVLKIFIKDGSSVSLDATDEDECNWLCLVGVARCSGEQNCMAIQMALDIFYMTTREVPVGEELLVWYAPHYAKKVGRLPVPDGVTVVMLGMKMPPPTADPMLLSVATATAVDTGQHMDATMIPGTPGNTYALTAGMSPTKQLSPRIATLAESPGVYTHASMGTREDTMGDDALSDGDPGSASHPVKCEPRGGGRGGATALPDYVNDTAEAFDEIPAATVSALSTLATPRQMHILHPHLATGPYTCKHCSREMDDITLLARHVKEHIQQSAKKTRQAIRANKSRVKNEGKRKYTRRAKPAEASLVVVEKELPDVTVVTTSAVVGVTPSAGVGVTPRTSRRLQEKATRKRKQDVDEKPTKRGRKKKQVGNKEEDLDVKREDEEDSAKEESSGEDGEVAPAKTKKTYQRSKKIEKIDVGDEDTLSISVSKRGRRRKPTIQFVDITADKKKTVQSSGQEETSVETTEHQVDVHMADSPQKCTTPVHPADGDSENQSSATSETQISTDEAPSGFPASGDAVLSSEDTGTTLTKDELTAENCAEVVAAVDEGITLDSDPKCASRQLLDAIMSLDNIDLLPMDADTDQTNHDTLLSLDGEAILSSHQSMVETSEEQLRAVLSGADFNSPVASAGDNDTVDDNGTAEPEAPNETGSGDENEESAAGIAETDTGVQNDSMSEQDEMARAVGSGDAIVDVADRVYVCRLCDPEKHFRKWQHLRRHLKGHRDDSAGTATSGGDRGVFACTYCGKKFEKENYLQRHIVGHTEGAHCVHCGKRYARKESLRKHVCNAAALSVKSETPQEGLLHCEFCGAGFTSEFYLARHMAAHTGEHSCVKCKRAFSRKESLLYHMTQCAPEQLKRDGVAVYPCNLCNKVFTRQVSLHNHMKFHDGRFKCITCHRAFASQFSLDRHTCSGEAPQDGNVYTCKECGKTFARDLYLQRHMAIHTGLFTCVICGRRYCRKEELMKHMLECSAGIQVETSGEIKCPVCGDLFTDAHTYRLHYTQHTHPYKCSQCGRMFLRKTNMDAHRCDPWDGAAVQCEICRKMFRHPKYLARHRIVHEEPKYTCAKCKKRFHRVDYYNDHMCVTETGERARIKRIAGEREVIIRSQDPLICATCGKSYISTSNLNKHLKTHGEKREACDLCGKRFHLKVALVEHRRSVHTDLLRHQCPYCSKLMKCKNSLYGHIAQFHSDTVRTYSCQQCGKTFRQKGNLKKHVLTHSNAKTYKCRYDVADGGGRCTAAYKYPEQLRRHELWHRHGHRYVCELCPSKKFIMEFELRKHVSVFHGGIVYVCEYCNTDCHHFHTMKRHLQRRHSDIAAWQTDTVAYIKRLATRTKNLPTTAAVAQPQSEQVLLPNQLLMTSDGQAVGTNGPDTEAPLIVAEVQDVQQDGTINATQTVIIQTGSGEQFEVTADGLVSQQIAEALQSITARGVTTGGTMDVINQDGQTLLTIGDVLDGAGGGQHMSMVLDEAGGLENQGYIIVPMFNLETVDASSS